MPAYLGPVRFAVCPVGFPPKPVGAYSVIADEVGMAEQSVLFEPNRWPVCILQVVITGGSLKACEAILDKLIALRTTKQSASDGQSVHNSVLVCQVEPAPARYVGLIVGGLAVSDTWEQEIRLHLLPALGV